jgi:hypothetical protein
MAPLTAVAMCAARNPSRKDNELQLLREKRAGRPPRSHSGAGVGSSVPCEVAFFGAGYGIHLGIIETSTEPPQGTSTVRLGAYQVGSPPVGLGLPRLKKRLPQRTRRRRSTCPYRTS